MSPSNITSQVSLGTIQDASRRLEKARADGNFFRTPLTLDRATSLEMGAEVFLKCENFQKTGSFKVRGALNRIAHFINNEIQNETTSRGVITCSAGNHGQALAFACSLYQIPCTVVMPAQSPENKILATQSHGARIVLHEPLDTIFERANEILEKEGLTFLHSFDDPILISGQGTVGLEIAEVLKTVDLVAMGVGGGGLISGVATAVKALNPRAKIIGVEPEGAPTLTKALEAGKPQSLKNMETIADGLKPPHVGKLNFEIARDLVDQVALVSDSEILSTVMELLDKEKMLVEPAGAAALAALKTGKFSVKDKQVAVILSGGNLDLKRLKSWI